MRAIELINWYVTNVWELYPVGVWVLRGSPGPPSGPSARMAQRASATYLWPKRSGAATSSCVWFCLLIIFGPDVCGLHLTPRDGIQYITVLRQLAPPIPLDDNASILRMMAPSVVGPYGNWLAAHAELAGKLSHTNSMSCIDF